jgi:hypothetical protein
MYLLLGVADGEIDSITDITVNGNALSSIENAYSEVRLGTNNQTAVTDMLTSVVEQQTFNALLPENELDTTWITKTQTETGSKIVMEFVHAQGIYGIRTDNSAHVPLTIRIRLQMREVGSSTWSEVFGDAEEPYKDVVKNVSKPYYWKHTITPPDDTKLYEFRAQNYTLTKLGSTAIPSTWVTSCNWLSLTVTDNVAETYPNLSLIALGLPASENLSGGMPQISCTATRSNVWVWDGSNYVQKDATNIAWMVYGIIHDCRYLYNVNTGLKEFTVFGEPAEKLDYASFLRWSQANSYGNKIGFGNLLLDSVDQLWTTIQKIAPMARAYIITQAGVFKPIVDNVGVARQVFTAGNIIAGSLKGEFIPEENRASAIEAGYTNRS